MAEYDLGTAKGKIVIDGSGATKGVDEAERAVSRLDEKGMSASDGMFKLSQGLLAIGTIGVAGFGLAIKTAADFEAQLSGIKAVSGATEDQMEALRKKALKLGADTVFSASESAGAMEELVKAGVGVEDILNGAADAVVNLAAAGGTDLATAAIIASNAMNQFNLSGDQMAHVSDLIAGAANASSIDVNDFGMALAQSGATANLIGLSFDDLALAITAMGEAGIKGSDAGTSIKTFLQNLQPVTERQIDLFRDLGITQDNLITQANPMGNAFFTATGSIKSMSEIAGVLETALAGMSDAQKTATLEAIFGTDAIRAAAIIAEQGAQGFDTLANSMSGISAADVAATRMDNLKGSVEQFKGSLDTMLITIGTFFLPMLRDIVDLGTDLINKFNELNPEVQKWVAFIGAGAAAMATFAGGMGIMMHIMSPFVAALKAVTLAFSANTAALLASPITWIVIAVIALAAAFVYAYTHIEGFRKAVDAALDRVVEFGQAVWTWINEVAIPAFKRFGEFFMKEVYPRIKAFVDSFIDVVMNIVDWITGTFVPFVTEAWGAFVDVLIAGWNWFNENVVSTLNAILEFVLAVFERIRQFVEEILIPAIIYAWNLLWPVVQTVWAIIQTIVETALDVIGNLISGFIDAVMIIWNLFGDNLWSAVKIAFDIVKTTVEVVLGIIRGIFQVLTGLITLDWDKFWEGIKTIASSVWEALQGIVRIGIDAIQLIIETVLDIIHAAWSLTWSAIQTTLQTTWDLIEGIVQLGIDTIKGIIDTVTNAIKMAWATAWDAVLSKVTIVWDTIKSVIEAALNFINDWIIKPIMDTIKAVWGVAWGAVKETVQEIFNGIKSAIDLVLGTIQRAIEKVLDAIKGAWQKAKDFVSGGLNPLGDIPGVPFLAKGGILTKSTFAVVAEAGPEAVIPLNDRERALELLNQSGLSALITADAGPTSQSAREVTVTTPALAASGRAMTAMNIEEAHFHDAMDLRTTLTEAEFALQGMSF